jgi:hypothetical protein
VLEGVIGHALNCELQTYAKESKLILTGYAVEGCPEELIQICFEKFQVPRLGLVPSPILVMYGTGRVEGVVVDVGHGQSNVSVCLGGQVDTKCTQSVPVGGLHLTEQLKSLVMESNRASGLGGKIMNEFGDLYIWNSMKEKFGRLATHGVSANAVWDAKTSLIDRRMALLQSAKKQFLPVRLMPDMDRRGLFCHLFEFDGQIPSGAEEYPMLLPDGMELVLRNELTNFGELLFQRSDNVIYAPGSDRMHLSPGRRYTGKLIGDFPNRNERQKMPSPRFEGIGGPRIGHRSTDMFSASNFREQSEEPTVPSLQDAFWNAIETPGLSNSHRKVLQDNVILCGGTTLLEGFEERFRHEVTARGGWGSTGIKLYAPEGREHLAWTGGSVLGMSSFAEGSLMSTREEYMESGPAIMQDRMQTFYS